MKPSKANSPYFRRKSRFDRISGRFFIGFTFLLVCLAAVTMVLKRVTEGEQMVKTVHLFQMPLTIGAAFWVIVAVGMLIVFIRWWIDGRRERTK